jgi:hypothetical protein
MMEIAGTAQLEWSEKLPVFDIELVDQTTRSAVTQQGAPSPEINRLGREVELFRPRVIE